MAAHDIIMCAAGAAGTAPLYVDDVFSAYTYTGNGSTQTITNGIDLAGKGGLVWIKSRNNATSHYILDTARGGSAALNSELTDAAGTSSRISAFNANGFSLTSANGTNTNTYTYVSHTFRKAPKFFDIVTYTGNGASDRSIPHSLGSAPGFVMIKKTSSTSDWVCWHRSISPTTSHILLNTTAAAVDPGAPARAYADASNLYVHQIPSTWVENENGATYVAYLFAHDATTDGIIQCGNFTTDGSGNATVNLGWEPQYLLVKRTDSSTAGNWHILDTMRGWNLSSSDEYLYANDSSITVTAERGSPTATGFNAAFAFSASYIYIAIRRPNKPPTTGTQVYSAIARNGSDADTTITGAGFPPDFVVAARRGSAFYQTAVFSRLAGALKRLATNQPDAEATDTNSLTGFDAMDGVRVGSDPSGRINGFVTGGYVDYFFKRAPGVFDVVAYTGTGSARTVNHNLGAVPELMIVKVRSTSAAWLVYTAPTTATNILYLNTTAASAASSSVWNDTAPTASVFSLGTNTQVNNTSATYIAYLFATKAGISKVGSYTGNGGSQTINCGFTTGSRFIMIKRTDSTGDWKLIDTARGIVAGNDPTLALNSTAAEVTSTDCIDPDNSGFIVNQEATNNLNVNAATYIYLSFS